MDKIRTFLTEELTTLFHNSSEDVDITFGTIVIEPGERVPKNGFSVHTGIEYSFIVEGEVEGESGEKPYFATKNDATFFPPGEPHWTINRSEKPCKIIWMMVEAKAK